MNINKILGFAIGPIASALLGLVTLPILTWVFTAEDIGRLNILQTTLSFCLLLTVLGLDQAYVREFHGTIYQAQLLKATFTPGFILLVMAALVAVPFNKQIAMLLFGVANLEFFWITLACVVAAFVSRFLSLILRMQERGLAFSMSQIIPKVLFLILLGFVFLFQFPRNFTVLLLLTATSSFTVLIVFMFNTRAEWYPAFSTPFDKQQLKSLFQFGAPLIFSGLAYWGLVATSSVALRTFSTFSELGVYSVTTSIAGVALLFQSIFTVVWAPIVYKWVADGVDSSRIDRVARQALALVCVIVVLCGSFSWLADYLLPPQYFAVKYLVLCAIVQPLFYTLSEITCVGIGISRRTSFSIWVTLLALSANILLSLWLVPLHGASGALIANALAYWVYFVARTEASAWVWRQFPRARLYVFTGFVATLAVATVAVGSSLPFHYSLIWLAVSPAVIWCFRVELRELITAGRHALAPQGTPRTSA